jgi:hypothetical protein
VSTRFAAVIFPCLATVLRIENAADTPTMNTNSGKIRS